MSVPHTTMCVRQTLNITTQYDCPADSLNIIFKLAKAAGQTARQDRFLHFRDHQDVPNCCDTCVVSMPKYFNAGDLKRY